MTSLSEVEQVDSARAFGQEALPPRAQTFVLLRSLEKIFQPLVRADLRTFREATGLPEFKVVLMLVFLMDLLFEVQSAGQKCRKGKFPRSVRNPAIPASVSKFEQLPS